MMRDLSESAELGQKLLLESIFYYDVQAKNYSLTGKDIITFANYLKNANLSGIQKLFSSLSNTQIQGLLSTHLDYDRIEGSKGNAVPDFNQPYGYPLQLAKFFDYPLIVKFFELQIEKLKKSGYGFNTSQTQIEDLRDEFIKDQTSAFNSLKNLMSYKIITDEKKQKLIDNFTLAQKKALYKSKFTPSKPVCLADKEIAVFLAAQQKELKKLIDATTNNKKEISNEIKVAPSHKITIDVITDKQNNGQVIHYNTFNPKPTETDKSECLDNNQRTHQPERKRDLIKHVFRVFATALTNKTPEANNKFTADRKLTN